jgi:hypothetical protein
VIRTNLWSSTPRRVGPRAKGQGQGSVVGTERGRGRRWARRVVWREPTHHSGSPGCCGFGARSQIKTAAEEIGFESAAAEWLARISAGYSGPKQSPSSVVVWAASRFPPSVHRPPWMHSARYHSGKWALRRHKSRPCVLQTFRTLTPPTAPPARLCLLLLVSLPRSCALQHATTLHLITSEPVYILRESSPCAPMARAHDSVSPTM